MILDCRNAGEVEDNCVHQVLVSNLASCESLSNFYKKRLCSPSIYLLEFVYIEVKHRI